MQATFTAPSEARASSVAASLLPLFPQRCTLPRILRLPRRPGFSLHDELALLVEFGFTPLAALQAATLRPAEFLGRSNELGSIAPGKSADLVLLSADPLADIHNTQIQAVWLRGKHFDRAALDQLLANRKHRHGKSKLD